MIRKLAIVGDIHGNVDALRGLLKILEGQDMSAVFVGDYVNRGPRSADVLSALVDHSMSDKNAVFLEGNHETAFKKFLAGGSAIDFLKVGGASTIGSYIDVDSLLNEVAEVTRAAVPWEHKVFLANLTPVFTTSNLIVTHGPDVGFVPANAERFHVFGHAVQRSRVPKIRASWAAIDTGCGSLPNGRLSAFVWPDRHVIQVDELGRVVDS